MKKFSFRGFGKTIVFIDATNIIYSLRSLGWKIDYKKLQKYFKRRVNLIDIYFYSAYAKEAKSQRGLFEMLSRKGFILRTKPLKYIKQKGKIIKIKGDIDVELAVDMIDLLRKYNTVILMSGDSDFTALVNYIKGKGKKVIIISTKYHVAHELIEAADKYFNLRDFKRFWELKKKVSKSKNPAKRGSG